MKINYKYYLSIFFLLGLSSCKNDSLKGKNGLIESRDSNNNLRKLEFMKNGVNDGVIANFYKNGVLSSFMILNQDSIKNGPLFMFYEDGRLNVYDNYVNNKKEGVSLHYTSKGILTRKSYFNNGLRDGKEFLFNFDTGDTLIINYYDSGKLIRTINK